MLLLEDWLKGESQESPGVPPWARGIVLALLSGLFVPLGGLIGAAWFWRTSLVRRVVSHHISKSLSRVVAFFSGSLISVTMLEIFPAAVSGTMFEGHDARWGYGFCTSVIFVSMFLIRVGKFVADIPEIVLERFRRSLAKSREAVDNSIKLSKGQKAADDFINRWMYFSSERQNLKLTKAIHARAGEAGNASSDAPSGASSLQMSSPAIEISKRSMESIQRIADSLILVAEEDEILMETLLKSAGRDIVDTSMFHHAEFCSFVSNNLGAPPEEVAEPLWSELYVIFRSAPTPEMLADLLEEPWEKLRITQQRRAIGRLGSKPTGLSVWKGPGGSMFNMIQNRLSKLGGTSSQIMPQSFLARSEQFKAMEEIIDKKLLPLLRVFSEHCVALMGHIFPGMIMFLLAQVDLNTSTDLVCLNALRNLPEGLLLIVDAMAGSTNSKKRQRCKEILASILIGLSECLGACLAYVVMTDWEMFDPLVYIGAYLCVGGSFIYLSVIKFMNCSAQHHPDNEIPTFSFASGAVVTGFLLVFLEAGPVRAVPLERGPRSIPPGGGGGGGGEGDGKGDGGSGGGGGR